MKRITIDELCVGDVMTGRFDPYGEPLRDRKVVGIARGKWIVVHLDGCDPEYSDSYDPRDVVYVK